ncbi:uncharacterized protein LOC116192486 isoform X2 [Punica granatum]|uniref:Uncharacterized protein LOC116192486 isoform X2 n=1 Tax=Punica granatum TaxID=22663 RepID=A0A218X1G0_PUNGR|nr:uncharacterized protein LOC116192486 isoform X2 [Punica granatum]OWM78549.1 hypothetical protein CDL15_Pgr016273 [Punica granatum]
MKCIGCKYTPSAVLGKECSTIEQSANNWASLPRDLLLSILGRLVPEVSDYIHFASVCKDWFSAARDHQALTHKRPFFPVLLIPAKDNSPTHRGWYNAVENRIVTDSRFRVPYNKRCCSSHGWLIFTEETLALTLFNPLSGATIHLPPVSKVPTKEELGEHRFYDHEYQVQKVVLSADPSMAPGNYEVLAIYEDGRLALFKCGWSTWIHVEWDGLLIREVTYFNGKFYAANVFSLMCLDVCSNKLESNSVSVTLRWPAERPLDSAWPGMTYLVGTPYGHLLWINRIHTYKSIGTHKDVRDDIKECLEASELIEENGCIRYRFTSRFEVYEVKKKEGSTTQLVAEPELIKTLDDMVLFLGHNESLLLSTP